MSPFLNIYQLIQDTVIFYLASLPYRRYEQQMVEADNQHKAEIKDLNSRVEILTKEKELQKEKYESQIAELDSTIRGFESKKSDSTNAPKQSSNKVDTKENS